MSRRLITFPESALVPIRAGDLRGFRSFFHLIHNLKLPQHANAWIEALFQARDEGKGLIVEAFRGSSKTTICDTFVAYMTGVRPEGSSVIVKANEESAGRSSNDIAAMISSNPMWKVIFPNVVPDPDRGWGEKGYHVKRVDLDYGEWTRLRLGPDASFVALPYLSLALLGMHPSNVLLLDDVVTRGVAQSDRELAALRGTITATIFPMRSPHQPLTLVIGTPWAENDPVQAMKATGEFLIQRTPVYKEDGSPTWPEFFGEAQIEKEKALDLSGGADFARQFLLDLRAASGLILKREWLHRYPADKIDASWPVVMGVDYASTADKLKNKERDYFALSVARLIPGGGAIIVDGVREHLSQGEADELLRAWAMKYPTLVAIVIEAIGKGEEFYHLMLRSSRMPIFPATTGRRSKGERFERQMAPLFRVSRVWLSNVENSFLRDLEQEWIGFPNAKHDDALDAVYYAIVGATQYGNLAPPTEWQEATAWFAPRAKSVNPYAEMARK